eukprot:scaffold47846_cov32-Prasinocladus_malaysianus.AAC.1
MHGETKPPFGVEQYTPPGSLLLSVANTLVLMSIHQFIVDKVCVERRGSQRVSNAADSAEKATLRNSRSSTFVASNGAPSGCHIIL